MAWSPQARRAALIARRRKARMTPKNRKAYRRAKAQARTQYYIKSASAPIGRKGKKTRRAALAGYDRRVNDARVKYLGKKHRSDRYLKNKRTAKKVAGYTALAVSLVPKGAVDKARGGANPYERVANKRQKAMKKAAAARYKQDRKMSTQARKRNLAAHGMNYYGQTKRSRKPVKVTSHRLPGQAMIGSR